MQVDRESKMDENEIALMRRVGEQLLRGGHQPDLYLFSRSGFTSSPRRIAKEDGTVHLVAAKDLFAGGEGTARRR